MIIWKKKVISLKLNKLIKTFNILINNVWSVEKNTESKIPKFVMKKPGRIMLLSKCAMCDSKKLKFIKSKKLGD